MLFLLIFKDNLQLLGRKRRNRDQKLIVRDKNQRENIGGDKKIRERVFRSDNKRTQRHRNNK